MSVTAGAAEVVSTSAMIEIINNRRWIYTEDTPLIILTTSLVGYWEGSYPPSAGRVVEASFHFSPPDEPTTDYDRACDVIEYIGIIPVGTGAGLILGDESMLTTILQSLQITYIVRASGRHSSLSSDLLNKLQNDMLWQSTGLTYQSLETPHILFDSVDRGSDSDEGIEFDLQNGVYQIFNGELRLDALEILVHKLEKISSEIP